MIAAIVLAFGATRDPHRGTVDLQLDPAVLTPATPTARWARLCLPSSRDPSLGANIGSLSGAKGAARAAR